MDPKLVDEINEKTPIVDLVSEFVSLNKRGKNYLGLCPFHQEKTPSFSVSPEKNIAMCMSCHEGGTPINFYRKIKNISFEEAATELALRAGLKVKEKKTITDPNEVYYRLMKEAASFYQFNLHHSEKSEEALNYLKKREMTDELIEHFMIGYAPAFGQSLYLLLKDKGFSVSDMIKLGLVKQKDDGSYYDLFSERIIFPITNPKGFIVGFSARTLNPNEKVKYMNSPETIIFKKGQLLYHYYEAISEIRRTKQVILCEGFFDVISSYQAGFKQVVATMGTALTKDQAKLMKAQSQSVIIAYDGDQAGIKAAEHAIPILEQEGLKVEVLVIPEQLDPDDFIKGYGPEAYERLFGEFTKDSYQFRYDHYKHQVNLQNANDIKTFKKQVMQMISRSDQSIRALYVKKLANDLNLNVEDIEIKTVSKPKPIQKEEKPKLRNKNENAERYLILAMLKSKKVALHVQDKLKQTDFADHIAAHIRLRIEDYYKEHTELELASFLDSLSEDQRNYMEMDLLLDYHWINQLEMQSKEIDQYIELVKRANLVRRKEYLLNKIDQSDEASDQDIAELSQVIRELKHQP